MSLIPGIHVLKRENWFSKVVPWPSLPYYAVCTGTHVYTYVFTSVHKMVSTSSFLKWNFLNWSLHTEELDWIKTGTLSVPTFSTAVITKSSNNENPQWLYLFPGVFCLLIALLLFSVSYLCFFVHTCKFYARVYLTVKLWDLSVLGLC